MTSIELQTILDTPVVSLKTDRRHKEIDMGTVATLEHNLELPRLDDQGIAPALLNSARQKRVLVVFSATRVGAARALEVASSITSPYSWLNVWSKRNQYGKWSASDLAMSKLAFRRDRPDAWKL
jgi:hypothetical protein